MQHNDLTATKGRTTARRIGRGGKRGKTSGKGHKGQKARAGRKIRPVLRDIIKKLPKRRGHGKNRARTVNSGRVKPAGVNLRALEIAFESGDRVTPGELVARKLVRTVSGRPPIVKILGTGQLTKRLTIIGCTASAAARAAVEKAGGKVA